MATINDIGIPGVGTGILEPKRKNRWRVTFANMGGGGVDSQPVSAQVITVTRPRLSFEEVALHRYNSVAWVAGKHTWEALTMTIQELEDQFTSGVYTKRPIALVRGAGAHVWDSDGVEYIDCVGGQGSVNVGHANPQVAAAIARQAQTLITCPEMFYNDQRAELEQRLTSMTNMPRVFLSNSGTEAVEAAIKFARLITGRTGIVAAMRGFHGRTYGALSATWEKKYREPFEPLVPDFSHITYNDAAALDEAIDFKTAAVLLEVVQGEGGVRPGTSEFLCKAQALSIRALITSRKIPLGGRRFLRFRPMEASCRAATSIVFEIKRLYFAGRLLHL